MRQRTTTIISLWPRACGDGNYRFGQYQIPAAPACECGKSPCRTHLPYSSYVISSATDVVDDGYDFVERVKKFHTQKIEDVEIAEDLASRTAHFGVLAIEGEKPTDEELAKAKEALDKYLDATLKQEDKYASRNLTYNREHAIIALQWFGQTRSWQADTSIKQGCPACGNMNPPNAIKCGSPTCQAILDWDRALDMGVLSDSQVKFGTERGKFKNPPVAVAAAPVVSGGNYRQPKGKPEEL